MDSAKTRVVAVSGVKHAGKTTLLEKLIPALSRRGISSAVIKHDGHRFDPDRPGTDTWRLLRAGACGTAIFDEEHCQIVRTVSVTERELMACFPEAELILLEGFKHTPYPKVEVWRRACAPAPVCAPETLLALVTDTPEAAPPAVPVFGLEDVEALSALLERYVRGEGR